MKTVYVDSVDAAEELLWDERFHRTPEGGYFFNVYYQFSPEVISEVDSPERIAVFATYAREKLGTRNRSKLGKLLDKVLG